MMFLCERIRPKMLLIPPLNNPALLPPVVIQLRVYYNNNKNMIKQSIPQPPNLVPLKNGFYSFRTQID